MGASSLSQSKVGLLREAGLRERREELGHRPEIWYVSLCAQGSLPLLQPLFYGLTWPGFGESQGSSFLAVSTFSTCCIGRGTGETQPQPGPVQILTSLG